MSKQSEINEGNEWLMDYMQDLEHWPIEAKTTWMAFSQTQATWRFEKNL